MKTLDPGTARATALRQTDTALGRVVENRVLTKPGAPEKRHISTVLVPFSPDAILTRVYCNRVRTPGRDHFAGWGLFIHVSMIALVSVTPYVDAN